MPEIASTRELFLHELGDILYVERALADKTLPKLIGEVQDAEFKKGLEKHLEETRQHVKNVEQAFRSLDEEPKAEPCLGFEGLKKEHDKLMEETSASLVDLVDLGAAARTENYEIAAYEGLVTMAEAMGETDVAELLGKNLEQEKKALAKVQTIGKRLAKAGAKEKTTV